MLYILQSVSERIVEKLLTALQTLWGWIVGVGLFIADYFAGHGFICGLVLFVTLMDAAWGITVSIKNGKFALSELARLTVAKLLVYGCAMAVFVGLDKTIDTNLTASVVGALIVLVEFWSASANMLIVYPHIPLLRLLKKALTGEIAAKLGIEAEDVEKELSKKSKKK